MIRPEKHTFKWSPKTKSKEDLKLVKDLEQLVKELDLTKTQLTRQALNNFVKKNKKMSPKKHYGTYLDSSSLFLRF